MGVGGGGGVSLSEDYKSCLLCWREQVGSAPENLFTHPSAYNYTSIRDIIIRSYYHGETQTPSPVLSWGFLLVSLRTNSCADTTAREMLLCAAAMPTENPKWFRVGDLIACVYISPLEANLGCELNSLDLDSNILFFLWAQNSYAVKHWVLFQKMNRISQGISWGKGRGKESKGQNCNSHWGRECCCFIT